MFAFCINITILETAWYKKALKKCVPCDSIVRTGHEISKQICDDAVISERSKSTVKEA